METRNKAEDMVGEMKAEFSDWEEAALSDINAWIEKSGKHMLKRKR